MTRATSFAFTATIAATFLTGCIDTDAAVFVEGSISDASASAQSSALASGLGGQFQLKFHLGARAAGDSEVTLRAVMLSNADRSQTLVPSLKVASSPAFPVVVPQGGDAFVQINYSADDNLFETAALAALCDPAGVVVEITFDDALLGSAAVAQSAPFVVQGCP